MHDCCSCGGTDSFISVIDHLPSASSPLSLHFSLNFHTPSPSSKQKKKKWHARFCSLSVCTSHFFIIPRSIDPSSSSSVRAAARPLTPWQPTAVWRQAGSALSADPGVLQQPLSRRWGGKVRAADSGGRERREKKKNGSLHLLFLPERGRANIRLRDGGESPLGSIKAAILHQLHRWQTNLSSLWATSGPIINGNLLCTETIMHGSNRNFLNNLG